jgi:hypothetical protein
MPKQLAVTAPLELRCSGVSCRNIGGMASDIYELFRHTRQLLLYCHRRAQA